MSVPEPLAYRPPDFSAPELVAAPAARLVSCEADGVLPEGFFATTNLPSYVKGQDGSWRMPREPRMDGCLVLDASGSVDEDGAVLAERRRGGYVIWVTGPALVHSRARDNLVWFIRHGFVQALLAGNAVAAHDIEAAVVGTTLGMTEAGAPTEGGHSAHMRAINAVRRAGSIAAAVRDGLIPDGIMHACVIEEVPFVLAGSIRDDGPLPDVFTDAVAAQDAMRAHTVKATMAVMVATALHSIAVGNMLPAYYEDPERGIVELPTICVDASEFLVSKLKDRGTHQAVGVVTNAQDFMSILRATVEEAMA